MYMFHLRSSYGTEDDYTHLKHKCETGSHLAFKNHQTCLFDSSLQQLETLFFVKLPNVILGCLYGRMF
uniref:Uncharacterized protein n=1 Tax=Oryza brachyantha TaxID=4533 RepID=J3N7I6_ORYBR